MDKGAHHYRCDFQVHTPRDPRWNGNGATTEEERLSFARELIASCRSKGLNAIAITDHHDLVMYQYVRRAALEEVDDHGEAIPDIKRIAIFPGMELTLGIPCQAIIIFDATLPLDFIQTIPSILGVVVAASDQANHAPVQRIDHLKDRKSVV